MHDLYAQIDKLKQDNSRLLDALRDIVVKSSEFEYAMGEDTHIRTQAGNLFKRCAKLISARNA